jgi:hypothetical protein
MRLLVPFDSKGVQDEQTGQGKVGERMIFSPYGIRFGTHAVKRTNGGWAMRQALRIVLTILMYAGVVVFLYPYVRGTLSSSVIFMIVGAGSTVLFGLLRCYLTEGDCGRVPNHGRDW